MPICRVVSIPGPVAYEEALARQYALVHQRQAGEAADTLLLLEHPPTITLGRRTHRADLLTPPERLREQGIAVVEADRGGEITYHAPGQLVGYPILDLRSHGQDLHRYLRDLEETLIRALAGFGIAAGRVEGLTGVWVGEDKIAAVGIKVSRWVSMHGFALNIALDLTPMRRDIVPCGIRGRGVTSLRELRPERAWTRAEAEAATVAAFADVFGVTPIREQEGILSP
ncbi:MAG: lipoyl(octanoyl) transferase LipB [Armatimonadetes bacterium]|nr:lipoyl(octanoyl) transferase LipB [Armatimonadota bacterium]